MASPVDFISGPKSVSTPGNLPKGKTASFTEILFVLYQGKILKEDSFSPAIILAAIPAN